MEIFFRSVDKLWHGDIKINVVMYDELMPLMSEGLIAQE